MTTPAIMFFESIKPLAVIGSFSVLLLSAPFLSFIHVNGYELVALFKNRENIEKLIKKIEELA